MPGTQNGLLKGQFGETAIQQRALGGNPFALMSLEIRPRQTFFNTLLTDLF